MTKQGAVLQHLQNHKSITSWEAITQYKATRLSAIIFDLRKSGYNIATELEKSKDVNGNYTQFARYILLEAEPKVTPTA